MSKQVDEPTIQAAFARIVDAILTVPDDAEDLGITLGKRADHGGGGWYWGLGWRINVGSVGFSRKFNRSEALKSAVDVLISTLEKENNAAS